MAINFHRVYLMTDLYGRFFPPDVPVTVAGCRITVDPNGMLQFGCCAGNEKGAIFYPVEVLEDADEVLLLKDLLAKPATSELIVWKLEPYTLEKWNEHGEAGKIPNFESLKAGIRSTEDLQTFLFNELVDDWWIGESKRMGVLT